jgi:multiple sugar transport system ATP-binding protein
MVIDAGSFNVKVPSDRMSAFERYVNRQVVFGIRPEDIHDPSFSPPGITAAPVEANVEVTELMGNEIFLHLELGGTVFTGRVDPRTTAKMGQKTQVVMNMENMHLFEPDGDQPAIR